MILSPRVCARPYLGRKPSNTRQQFTKVQHLLGQNAVGIARIAKETGLTRQTIYRIKDDPTAAAAALAARGGERHPLMRVPSATGLRNRHRVHFYPPSHAVAAIGIEVQRLDDAGEADNMAGAIEREQCYR